MSQSALHPADVGSLCLKGPAAVYLGKERKYSFYFYKHNIYITITRIQNYIHNSKAKYIL